MFRMKFTGVIVCNLLALQATVSFAGSPAFSGRVAAADSAETAASNPAGMSRLGESAATVQLMMAQSFGKFEVDDNGTNTSGGDPDDKSPLAIPFGYYVKQLDEHWHAGISLTVPNGFGADYGNDWAGRYYSDSYSLVYVMLAPAVSYRFDKQLSLGASLGINYVSSESKTAFKNSPGVSDGQIEANVDGVGFSLTLSGLYEIDPRTRVGLVYTTQSVSDLEGDLKFHDLGPVLGGRLAQQGKLKNDIEISNRLPQRIMAGVYHELDSGNYFTVDGGWMEFSKFGTTSVALNDTDLAFDDDGTYNDLWALSIGAGFPSGKYTWKAGLFYLSSAVDDDKRTLAMALDRVIGVGGGVSFPLEGTRRMDINVNLLDSGEAPVDTGDKSVRGRVVGQTENPYVLMLDAAFHF
jgi:long-chain fatty acid transport protein